jgi:hypothetical protein
LKRNESQVAIRGCFDGQGIAARMVNSDKSGCRFVVEGRTGRFDIYLEVLKEQLEILHYKTSIKPHQPAQIVGSPRDLLFGGTPKNQKVAGTIHFTQKGPASAIAYASFHDAADGTLLYFQIQKDTPVGQKKPTCCPHQTVQSIPSCASIGQRRKPLPSFHRGDGTWSRPGIAKVQ